MGEKCKIPGGLGIGTWQFGDDPYWPGQQRKESLKAIDAALRAGIIHFDTAQVYGNGRAEQLIGQRLRKRNGELFLATKLFQCPPSSVEKRIALSRRRLFRESIDLLYIHWPKEGEDPRPMMEALERERRKGSIAGIGLSNFTVEQADKVLSVGKIDACQIGHSLLWRHAEGGIIPWCREHDIPVIAYAPLAQGLLAGSFEKIHSNKEDRRNRLLPMDPILSSALGRFLESFEHEADSIGVPPAGLALAWSLSRPFLQAIVVGVRNRKQAEKAAAARSFMLSPQTEANLETISLRFRKACEELADFSAQDNIFGHGRKHA